MRYLVYILVVANFAFLAWNVVFTPQAKPLAAPTVPVPPGIDSLVLLSERTPDAAVDVLPETEQADTPIADDEAQEIQATSADVPKTANEQQQRTCRTVGPFLDKEDAVSVFAILARQNFVVEVRDGDVRDPAGYWVYLPAMASKEARRIVADLDAHGMKDYFIGKQNHISLGIFSDKEKARTRQRTVKNLGYDAVLDQRYRVRDVFWLDVEEQAEPLLGSDTWRVVQAQHADIRVQRVSCE